ncbi:MAG: site-specific DNA-methyltransferase [Thermoproteota archaeon]|jgi:site-specific DNA-methyltransferase (adenine-specific)|nr:site-specific DNA-methyltransferase [Thermoproteota archaeon]
MKDEQIRKRISTESSSFGISKREGHDSSKFYKRKLYDLMKNNSGDNNGTSSEHDETLYNKIESGAALNKIFCKSSKRMDELPDSSVHLMVTSPPYNVGKEYDEDLTFEEYRTLLRSVFKETYRVLVKGGRACINIANLGRKPYIPLHSFIIQDMLDIGFLMRGEIVWNKSASSGVSTAWGSWQSASNPTLRDIHEYVLIFSKGSFSRSSKDRGNTISKEEFLTFTKSIWEFPAESANKVGHPAPFPLELPYRCIQLYTFKGDVVLDPFCGVGTTCLSAVQLKRNYVGYDTNKQYVDAAIKRIDKYL